MHISQSGEISESVPTEVSSQQVPQNISNSIYPQFYSSSLYRKDLIQSISKLSYKNNFSGGGLLIVWNTPQAAFFSL